MQVTVEANEVPNVKVEAIDKDGALKYGEMQKVKLRGTVSLASNAGAEFLL